MKVLVTGNLPGDVAAPLVTKYDVTMHPQDYPMDRDAILSSIHGKHGLLCMITDGIDETVFESAPGLKIVANFGVGFNNIDVKAATDRGIMVTNTPGVLTDATADITMALILTVGRRVVEGDQYTRHGKFRFWAPYHFLGHEITGKTLGIVGMGRIGAAVARRAAGFNMPVIYHNRHRLPEDEEASLGQHETGSRAASPIWVEFMKQLLKDKPARIFQVPESVVFSQIDAKTGLLPIPESEKTIFECFKEGTVPTEYTPKPDSVTEPEQFFKMDM